MGDYPLLEGQQVGGHSISERVRVSKVFGRREATSLTRRKEPPAPASLGDIGREKWNELAPKLMDHSPFTLDQLELYSRAYERWHDAQAWLVQHGDILVLTSEKTGQVTKAIPSPRLKVAQEMEKAMQEASYYLGNKVRS